MSTSSQFDVAGGFGAIRLDRWQFHSDAVVGDRDRLRLVAHATARDFEVCCRAGYIPTRKSSFVADQDSSRFDSRGHCGLPMNNLLSVRHAGFVRREIDMRVNLVARRIQFP